MRQTIIHRTQYGTQEIDKRSKKMPIIAQTQAKRDSKEKQTEQLNRNIVEYL